MGRRGHVYPLVRGLPTVSCTFILTENPLRRRYPHLPALEYMTPERRQYYANKVRCIFLSSPHSDTETLDYLDRLSWPNLRRLEIEIDLKMHSAPLINMLHDKLEHVDLSGTQSGGSKHFTETILPMIFVSFVLCHSLSYERKTNKSRAHVRISRAFALALTQSRTMTLYMSAPCTNI